METVTVLLSVVIPWLAGFAAIRLLLPHPRPGRTAALLGYGYFVGLFAATLLMRGFDALGMEQNFWPLAGCLLLLAAAAAWAVRYREEPKSAPCALGAGPGCSSPESALLALAAAFLLAHFLLNAGEVLTRPLYPWDAVSAWAQKTAVWFEAGRLVPFVSFDEWLDATGQGKYTAIAHHYPPTVPLTQLWTLLALGRWDDAVMNLPWLVAAVALTLLLYGELRQWELAWPAAFAVSYAVVSLPLFDTHVALAGYADLWQAAVFAVGASALLGWRRGGGRGYLVLFAAAVLMSPQIKAEGTVWAALLLAALGAGMLRARWVLAAIGVAVFLLTALALLVAMAPGGVLGGWLQQLVGWHFQLAGMEIRYHPLWGELYEHMFARTTWHLFWLFAAAAALAGLWAPRRPWSASAYALLFGAPLSVLVAFLFTDNARFLELGTTINRALLQTVPVVAFTGALLLAALLRRQAPEPTPADVADVAETRAVTG